MLPRARTGLIALAAALLVLSGCGSDNGGGGQASKSKGSSSSLQTLTPGKLTIGTGQPAYSPWVEDDKPESGKGFEAAVAYAVAAKLGFAKSSVVWVRTPFDSVISPGPKDFDFNLQQFSITDQRKKAVDFSSPYYVTTPALVSIKGNRGADAKSLADLKDVTIGAAVGTTTLTAVQDAVQPTQKIQTFNSNEDAVQALRTKTIDVLAVDLPTALYLANAELKNGVIVGQLDTDQGGDKFGLLLQKGSPLTQPVTKAVDSLRQEGVLDALAKKWLTDTAGAPVLK
ncbi:MAG: amino acid ABC transporter substrate-binding protein [Marmoricola sp.]|nr:amino acid ABC transporter substrate-binding protein [Marmoricola sp.]